MCPFRTLPSEVGFLKQLKLIDVSFNKLTSLPASMAGLENLQSLDLAKNEVRTGRAKIETVWKLKCKHTVVY